MKIKFFRLIMLILLVPGILPAQTEETLTGDARIKGGFGGPFFLYSTVGEMHGRGAGGGGGFIIDKFFIGGFGQGETFGKIDVDDQDYYVSIGYGGLWFGYVAPSNKLLHLLATMKIGWGEAFLSENRDDHSTDYNDGAFVIQPEVGIELNVAHWFRIAGQAGYRFMNGVNDIPTLQSNDFDSPSFALVLRFGAFGYDR
ncbi:MAG TPA: hypothetical protein VI603_07110 [Saprospiraceae bacterium]|nr:hypothetical protein [Saprospiraceae bacterium]